MNAITTTTDAINDVDALRNAVTKAERAALRDSNDTEIQALQEALDLAQKRVPSDEVAATNAELEKLADGDSNDAEIETLQGELEGALRFWPEIDVEAIKTEVEDEDY